MTKTVPTPKANLAAKSQLARLMAAEDIAVEVDASAPTAYFNVEERRLVLPLWDVEGDAYDMLVGHEVSHALYTPEGAAALEAACKKVDPKNYGVAKDYLNVVEDARIERLIKVDYPGLRRSFAAGYREFHARDIFGLKGQTVSDLPLIDRINLQYKIGWLIDVPFTAAELPLVQRVATTRTWDEVVALSKEIYEFAKKQKEEEKQKGQDGKPEQGKQKPQDGEEGDASAPSNGGDDDEAQDGESESDGLSNGEDESGGESGGKSLNDGDEGEESDEQGGGESKGDGTAEGTEDDTDDGESAESDKVESSRTGTNDANSGTDPSDLPPDASTTSKAMNEALNKMVKASTTPIIYADLPDLPTDFVIPFARVEKAAKDAVATIRDGDAMLARVYGVWKNKNQSDVLALATEFERRKAADAHRRTVTAETGALDPTRLFAYKISDDIFLRSSTVQDGKNHGLVILLDMSGSMSNQMLDTMVQLVNLTAFARRVNIPFKVYGFVDFIPAMADGKKAVWKVKQGGRATWDALKRGDDTGGTHVRLMTLLESGTTQARWQKMAGSLLAWAASLSREKGDYFKALRVNNAYYDVYYKFSPHGFTLNGTPTNEALMGLLHLVPQFKRDNNLQVVNTVILTDGEAGDQPLTHHKAVQTANGASTAPLVIVRDPVTRREYKTWRESKTYDNRVYNNVMYSTDQQSLLVAMLRERTGARVLNINLVTGLRGATYMIESFAREAAKQTELRKKFKSEGWVGLPNHRGFDEVIALNTANAEETEFDFDAVTVDTDTKQGQRDLAKAFVKSLESRKGNRPLMARIAELVSKNL